MDSAVLSPKVINLSNIKSKLYEANLIIVAAGFEDRALHFFNNVWNDQIKNLLIIKYASQPKDNNNAFEIIMQKLNESSKTSQNISYASLDTTVPSKFNNELIQVFKELNLPNYGSIWIDVSGIPNFAICVLLKICRSLFPLMRINIIYTESKEYFPTEKDYRKYHSKYGDEIIERLPASLTSEMSENIILQSFSGVIIREDPTCLIIFVGYEKHRTLGAIENINPNKIVTIYGKPGRTNLKWRLEMSKNLHSTLINERIRAEEVTSTLSIAENYQMLYEYYDMLYDNHNICIAPINSKMQAVATYLIWEMFRDIQLVFPMPIKYLPKRFSSGIGKTYHIELPLSEGAQMF